MFFKMHIMPPNLCVHTFNLHVHINQKHHKHTQDTERERERARRFFADKQRVSFKISEIDVSKCRNGGRRNHGKNKAKTTIIKHNKAPKKRIVPNKADIHEAPSFQLAWDLAKCCVEPSLQIQRRNIRNASTSTRGEQVESVAMAPQQGWPPESQLTKDPTVTFRIRSFFRSFNVLVRPPADLLENMVTSIRK